MVEIAPDDGTAKVSAWLRANVGEVVRIRRQPRWRPVWFADVERDGELPRAVRPRRPHRHAADLPARPRDASAVDHARPRHPDAEGLRLDRRSDGLRDGPRARRATTSRSRPTTSAARSSTTTSTSWPACTRSTSDRSSTPASSAPPGPTESGTFGMSATSAVFRQVKVHPDPFIEFALAGCGATRRQSHGREARDRLGLGPVPPSRRQDRRGARRRDRPHRRPDDGPRRVADARHGHRLRRLRRALRPLQRAHR